MKWGATIFAPALLMLLSGCALFSDASRTTSNWTGSWQLTTPDGPADLHLYKNGQAVWLGPPAPKSRLGARGFWRPDRRGITAIFDDARAIALNARGDVVEWSALGGKDTARWSATRIEGEKTELLGLWRLNPEPEGDYLYLAVRSDGSISNSVNRFQNGTWAPWKNGILCRNPDGWRDLIVRDGSTYRKMSWPPGASQSDPPTDTSIALRVGETPFELKSNSD